MLNATPLFAVFLRRRTASTFRRNHSAIEYPLTHPIYTIWAANTSLGKTLVSAGLSISFLSSSNSTSSRKKFLYLKPIQTGFPDDSDSRFVYRKFAQFHAHKPSLLSVFASNQFLKASVTAYDAMVDNGFARRDEGNGDFGADSCENGGGGFRNLQWYQEMKLQGSETNESESFPVSSELICKTMYGWKEAVSPHLAAEREGAVVGDADLLDMLKRCLVSDGLDKTPCVNGESDVMCVIETAGGVASPGPSGALQCDLYRPFRLPAIIVGDGRLGGISGTISAYESLKIRGYDVAAVVLENHGLANEVPLSSYFRNRVPVLVLPSIPTDMSDDLISWFDSSRPVFNSLKEIMLSSFLERTRRLIEMPKKACEVFWWPFTQHKLVPEEKVTVIDSRCGENLAVHKSLNNRVSQQFDACASWWTQGPDVNLQVELARDMGYTAARYGHVMFPENVYEPALGLAEVLLEGVGKGWASRVYFSDNGSTAVEIALKMAFRKFLSDNKMVLDPVNSKVEGNHMDLKVFALRGSYHGDTLGAMEAQAPSHYTGLLQQPWYSGRGIFLDPPTVFMRNGTWEVSIPEKMQSVKSGRECMSFMSRDGIFKRSRDASSLASLYTSFISQEMNSLLDSTGISQIGALIIEPVVHGAGGMHLIDPLYQRLLVKECKSRKIPVIFDEVFTGFWRLGKQSAAELLHIQPDIACYAKLMTGGIIPLAATLASDAVFEAFSGDSKLLALLHGHSYSAHAMGCMAALTSVKWFKDCNTNMNLMSKSRSLQELWDTDLVVQISLHPAVDRVVALGTLCAIELKADGCNAGYASTYASSLLNKLREDGIYMRPLGNVIYLMCGPLTSPNVCYGILEKVHARIQEFGQQEDNSVSYEARS